jgi:hypothetical protein
MRADQRRIQVAQLDGTAQRHASLIRAGQSDEAAAIAELHGISGDPAVLTDAARRHTTDDANELMQAAAKLLEAAGANLTEARKLWDERQAKAAFSLGKMTGGISKASREQD